MKTSPSIDRNYWLCLCIASIFGANAGDYLADGLDLGHLDGVPYLAVAIILLLAMRHLFPVTAILLYWATIAVVRAAATNIGDISHDLQLSFFLTSPIVAVVLAALVVVWKQRRAAGFRMGDTAIGGYYWITMFTAGVLGTLVGDCASFRLGLGNFWAMVILAIPLVPLFFFGRNGRLTSLPYYWLTVAFIRSSGTAAGDLFAHSALGLEGSTLLFGLVYTALVVGIYAWRRPAGYLDVSR